MNKSEENLVIVSISGGLGNQMFQCAFGKVLELKTGRKILYDVGFFESEDNAPEEGTDKTKFNCDVREYGLDVFPNLKIEFASKEQIEKCIDFKGKKRRHLPGFLRKILKLEREIEISNKVAPYSYSDFDEKYFNIEKDAYFFGYWQNEKYFAGFEEEIRNIFKLPEIPAEDEFNTGLLKKIKECENPVMIHIRRGDYSSRDVLPDSYYKNAVKYIKKEVQNPKFFIFGCDCEDYIQNTLNIGAPFEFVTETNHKNNEDWKDLKLMGECRHAIIANSSFSWWGAWLTDNPNKIIAAPNKWRLGRNDVVCSKWCKVRH